MAEILGEWDSGKKTGGYSISDWLDIDGLVRRNRSARNPLFHIIFRREVKAASERNRYSIKTTHIITIQVIRHPSYRPKGTASPTPGSA